MAYDEGAYDEGAYDESLAERVRLAIAQATERSR
jgi:hypothetical protein